jgi:hypothetical protein
MEAQMKYICPFPRRKLLCFLIAMFSSLRAFFPRANP